jgi:hypothetical protein
MRAINLIAICEHLLLSKVSVSEGIEYRRKTEANKNDATITVTTNTTTKTKI